MKDAKNVLNLFASNRKAMLAVANEGKAGFEPKGIRYIAITYQCPIF